MVSPASWFCVTDHVPLIAAPARSGRIRVDPGQIGVDVLLQIIPTIWC